MNTRQWLLYDLLKETKDYLSQQEIYNRLLFYYEWNGKTDFHGSVGRQISADIQAINLEPTIQKIILTTSAGHKLATAHEYKMYSLAKWRELKAEMYRLAYKDSKAKLDGQMKIIFGDSQARNFYESFVKED